jgi:hypothetical protein
MDKKTKTFYQRAKSWAAKEKLTGASAFSRFVMMTFVDHLNQVTDEFVFKGGNLLWVYIRTPSTLSPNRRQGGATTLCGLGNLL